MGNPEFGAKANISSEKCYNLSQAGYILQVCVCPVVPQIVSALKSLVELPMKTNVHPRPLQHYK